MASNYTLEVTMLYEDALKSPLYPIAHARGDLGDLSRADKNLELNKPETAKQYLQARLAEFGQRMAKDLGKSINLILEATD